MLKRLAKNLLGAVKKRYKSFDDLLQSLYGNTASKADLFPYRFYDEKKMLYFLDKGAIGFIYECTPLVGIEDEIYKQLSLLFDDQLPQGGNLDFLMLGSDDISEQLYKWGAKRENINNMFDKLRLRRIKFIKEYNETSRSNFKHRDYKLIISYSQKTKDTESLDLFRARFESILKSINIQTRHVFPRELLKITLTILNANSDFQFSFLDPLASQISDFSSPLAVNNHEILTNKEGVDYITKVYEVKNFPRKFSIQKMVNLLGDPASDALQVPCKFAIIYSVSNGVSKVKQESYAKKGNVVIEQSRSMLGKLNTSIDNEALEWEEVLGSNLKKRERFLRRHMMVMLCAKDTEIENAEQTLISLWRKNDFILRQIKYIEILCLISFCPLMSSTENLKYLQKFGLRKTVVSSDPAALLPIHGEWRGSDNGGVLLTGKRGQLFSWNNFEGGSNYNVCVVGQSGSGKSVFLQEFVMGHLAEGSRVFVVDIGRSFEKSCKIIGGDFINFAANSNISLNPFSNIPDEGIESPIVQDSLNYLKLIISKMVGPKSNTTEIQDAIISSAVNDVWSEHGPKATIDLLVAHLQSKGEREKEIALILFDFSSRGSYGKFFNGSGAIKFSKQMTVLEFEELRELPSLGSVIMQMLSMQIVQQIYLGNRKQKCIILFDEAWYALENFPQLLASMARTVRKYNGALVLGTQSLKNFYGTEGARDKMAESRIGVIENSAWRIMLKQSGESADSLKQMKMPNHLIEAINDLRTVSGQYSEVVIYQSGKNYFSSRLMIDKFAQTLYSSSPEVFSGVKKLIDEGMSTAEAIEAIADYKYYKKHL